MLSLTIAAADIGQLPQGVTTTIDGQEEVVRAEAVAGATYLLYGEPVNRCRVFACNEVGGNVHFLALQPGEHKEPLVVQYT